MVGRRREGRYLVVEALRLYPLRGASVEERVAQRPHVQLVQALKELPQVLVTHRGGVLPTRDGAAGATTTIYSNVGAGIAVAT